MKRYIFSRLNFIKEDKIKNFNIFDKIIIKCHSPLILIFIEFEIYFYFIFLDSQKQRTAKSHSYTSKLHNFDFSSMRISNQQETKDLQDMIINNFNFLEDEYLEIDELESQLIFLRDNLMANSEKPESIEICKKTTIVSDIEDGYKSANSYASEKNSNFSNYNYSNQHSASIKNITVTPRINLKEKNLLNNKYPILTSVTIDLNKI